MPPAQDGRDRSPSFGVSLRSLRDCARSGADEVLSHLPELGDREVQSVVDAYLDQVADLLRELDASASDLADRLDIAGSARTSRGDRAATSAVTASGDPVPPAAPATAGHTAPARGGWR
jgi:hypothetical protein